MTGVCPWDSETMRAKTKPADAGGWHQPRENTLFSLFLAPLSLPSKIKLQFSKINTMQTTYSLQRVKKMSLCYLLLPDYIFFLNLMYRKTLFISKLVLLSVCP